MTCDQRAWWLECMMLIQKTSSSQILCAKISYGGHVDDKDLKTVARLRSLEFLKSLPFQR